MSHAAEAGSRREWVDAAKGLLIVLVVFWHVVLKTYLQVDWRIGLPIPGVWGLASDVIWPFLMPLFLLISGLLAAPALSRPWAIVLRTRVARFLYLYLLWTLIHMAAMWAFPDFPTLVPRGIAEFVEAVTISPPNTWYLYALAVYFLVAKALRRAPRWVPIGAAAILAIAVAAGLVDVVSNRGSLLYNFVFFLLGLHLAPRILRGTTRPRPLVAAASVVVYIGGFALMRLSGAEQVPGVWPLVSLLGVVMGLSTAPVLAAAPGLGRGLRWLGRRTLPIYVMHMPLLAVLDAALVPWLSGARIAVQLAAAVVLPILLTGALVAACVVLGRVLDRDGFGWLFDLPRRWRGGATASPSERKPRLLPWRSFVSLAGLAVVGVFATSAAPLPQAPEEVLRVPAARPGEVSIGAVGDVLIYDTGHEVPTDGGRDHFAGVRPWFTQDIVTGNLEQAITDDTGYEKCEGGPHCLAFRSEPDSAPYFEGFDLLALANNHSRDFGRRGYDATRAHLADLGIRTVGDPDEISYTRVGETTVAVIAFAPYDGFTRLTDLRHVRRVVAFASEHADLVVVHAHMGAEGPGADVVRAGTERMFGENRGDPVRFAHTAVDAGADLVIGHGPHVMRGMEFYDGRLIAYSLGNFGGGGVFGAEEETRVGAYLDVRLGADGTFIDGRVRSVRFDQAGGVPAPDPEGRAAAMMHERGLRDFPTTAVRLGEQGEIVSGPQRP